MRLLNSLNVLALAGVFAGICLSVAGTHAEVYSDTTSTPYSWRFSSFDCGCPPCLLGQCCSYFDLYRVDMLLVIVFDPPLGWGMETPMGGQPLGDIPLDSVSVAPRDGYQRTIDSAISEEPAINRTYVLRTRDGGHAIIRILSFNDRGLLRFAYKYQNDGSGIFISVPVEATTWGRLKALYPGRR